MKLYFFVKVQHTGDTDLGQADVFLCSLPEKLIKLARFCKFAYFFHMTIAGMALIYWNGDTITMITEMAPKYPGIFSGTATYSPARDLGFSYSTTGF